MNEKKIIAISERDFMKIAATAYSDVLKNKPINKTPSTVEEINEYAGKQIGKIFGRLHAELFSDKYAIGKLPASYRQIKYKKKCRRSSGNANSDITKNTTIFYHETDDLSRGNEK